MYTYTEATVLSTRPTSCKLYVLRKRTCPKLTLSLSQLLLHCILLSSFVLFRFLANVNSCSCSLYVVVRPSVCRLSSVTFVHPTQAIKIFRNVSTPFGTLAICDPSVKILRRSSQGNPSVGGLNQKGVEKCSDFGHFQGYISETVV